MKSNVEARIQQKEDQKTLAAYAIVYCKGLLGPERARIVKTEKTRKELTRRILREFNRLLVEEFHNKPAAVVDALFIFDRVKEDLELKIDTRKIRDIVLLSKDKTGKYTYLTMAMLLTIAFYNVKDEYIKRESQQKKLAQMALRRYMNKCLTGLTRAGSPTRFTNQICNDSAFLPD